MTACTCGWSGCAGTPGQTAAMVAGIDHARGRVLITMDGDLQNDPADIPLFLDKIAEGYDLVVGWRHKRQDHFSRVLPSKVANWLIAKVTGVPIKDNGCSLKAYRADLIKRIPLYSEMHRFIPAMASLAAPRLAQIKVPPPSAPVRQVEIRLLAHLQGCAGSALDPHHPVVQPQSRPGWARWPASPACSLALAVSLRLRRWRAPAAARHRLRRPVRAARSLCHLHDLSSASSTT